MRVIIIVLLVIAASSCTLQFHPMKSKQIQGALVINKFTEDGRYYFDLQTAKTPCRVYYNIEVPQAEWHNYKVGEFIGTSSQERIELSNPVSTKIQ